MYLVIDSSEVDTLRLHSYVEGSWHEQVATAVPVGQFVSTLSNSLGALHSTIQDIAGIAVVVGKGRFTATRVAVTVANTLAFALHVPVVGVTEFKADTVVAVIKATPVGEYVIATYSAPARIGAAKVT